MTVKSIVKITNHSELASDRLPQQYKDAPGVHTVSWEPEPVSGWKGTLDSFTRRAQDLEDIMALMLAQRSLTTAAGVNLDRIGQIVGMGREGRDDDSYRVALFGQIASNNSNATARDLLFIASTLMGDDLRELSIVEMFPAKVVLEYFAEVQVTFTSANNKLDVYTNRLGGSPALPIVIPEGSFFPFEMASTLSSLIGATWGAPIDINFTALREFQILIDEVIIPDTEALSQSSATSNIQNFSVIDTPGSPGNDKVAQTLIAPVGALDFRNGELYFTGIGSTDVVMQIDLHDWNGSQDPDLGTLIGTTSVAITSADFGQFTPFSFASPLTVVAGNQYAVVIQVQSVVTLGVSDTLLIVGDVFNLYPDGEIFNFEGGGSWNDFPWDLAFEFTFGTGPATFADAAIVWGTAGPSYGFTAGQEIDSNTIGDPIPGTSIDPVKVDEVLDEAKAAGVGIDVTPVVLGNYFGFKNDSEALGFGSLIANAVAVPISYYADYIFPGDYASDLPEIFHQNAIQYSVDYTDTDTEVLYVDQIGTGFSQPDTSIQTYYSDDFPFGSAGQVNTANRVVVTTIAGGFGQDTIILNMYMPAGAAADAFVVPFEGIWETVEFTTFAFVSKTGVQYVINSLIGAPDVVKATTTPDTLNLSLYIVVGVSGQVAQVLSDGVRISGAEFAAEMVTGEYLENDGATYAANNPNGIGSNNLQWINNQEYFNFQFTGVGDLGTNVNRIYAFDVGGSIDQLRFITDKNAIDDVFWDEIQDWGTSMGRVISLTDESGVFWQFFSGVDPVVMVRDVETDYYRIIINLSVFGAQSCRIYADGVFRSNSQFESEFDGFNAFSQTGVDNYAAANPNGIGFQWRPATPSLGFIINSAFIVRHTSGNAPTIGSMSANLYRTDDTGKPVGSPITSSHTLPATTHLTTSFKTLPFAWPRITSKQLFEDTRYFMAFEHTGDGVLQLQSEAVGTYPDGISYELSGAWSSISPVQINFKLDAAFQVGDRLLSDEMTQSFQETSYRDGISKITLDMGKQEAAAAYTGGDEAVLSIYNHLGAGVLGTLIRSSDPLDLTLVTNIVDTFVSDGLVKQDFVFTPAIQLVDNVDYIWEVTDNVADSPTVWGSTTTSYPNGAVYKNGSLWVGDETFTITFRNDIFTRAIEVQGVVGLVTLSFILNLGTEADDFDADLIANKVGLFVKDGAGVDWVFEPFGTLDYTITDLDLPGGGATVAREFRFSLASGSDLGKVVKDGLTSTVTELLNDFAPIDKTQGVLFAASNPLGLGNEMNLSDIVAGGGIYTTIL